MILNFKSYILSTIIKTFYLTRLHLTDQEIVANRFNNYFVNVAQHLLKGLGEASNKFINIAGIKLTY